MEWKDIGYNFHRLDLPGGFQIIVGWDRDGYKVTFEQVSLKSRFPHLTEAKSAGVNLARHQLTKAIQFLGE